MLQQIRDLYYQAYVGLPRKVWYLSLILLINRSGTMVIPFLTVFLTTKQGYTAAEASWVMVAFGSGGIVGNYVGGLLNDRFGSWHIQAGSLFGSAIIFFLLARVEHYLLFCLLIFFLSVIADAFRPANRAAVATYTPKDRLTKAFGLQRMAVNLGFSIGPLAGGIILTYFDYEMLFWADGLTCLFSGIAFLLLIPIDETARPQRAVISEDPSLLDAPQVIKPSSAGHLQAWLMTLCVANVLVAMCFFQLFSTAPVYLEKLGYQELQIGYLFTLSGLLIVVFEMPLLHLAEGRYVPLRVLLFGSSLIALSYFLLPITANTSFFALCIFIIILTFGEMLYMPFGSTYVTLKAPVERRGEYLGLLSASYSMAFVLSPLAGLNLAESLGFGPATYILAGGGALGVLLLFQLYTSGAGVRLRRKAG